MSYYVGDTTTVLVNSKFKRNGDSAKFTYVINLPRNNQYTKVAVLNAKIPHTYYQVLNYGRNGKNTFQLNISAEKYLISIPEGNYSVQGLCTILEEKICKYLPNSTVTFPLDVEGRQKGQLQFTFHNPTNSVISLQFFNHVVYSEDVTQSQLDAFNASLPTSSIDAYEYARRLSDQRSKYILDIMGFDEGIYTIPSKTTAFAVGSLVDVDIEEYLRRLIDNNKINFIKTSTTLTMDPTSLIPASIQFDNISLTTGNTILLTGMYDSNYNGVYTIAFTASTSFVLTRTTGYDQDGDFDQYSMFSITNGYEHYGEYWQLTNDPQYNLNSSALDGLKSYSRVLPNVINGIKTPHTKIPSTIILSSDCVDAQENGDYSLIEIDTTQTNDFGDIIWKNDGDIPSTSKTLRNSNTNIFNFDLESDDREVLDLNGLEITFTLLFYEENVLPLYYSDELSKQTTIQNLEEVVKIKEDIANKKPEQPKNETTGLQKQIEDQINLYAGVKN